MTGSVLLGTAVGALADPASLGASPTSITPAGPGPRCRDQACRRCEQACRALVAALD